MGSIILELRKTIQECESGHIQLRENIDDSGALRLSISDRYSVNQRERSNQFLKNLAETKEFQDNAHRINEIRFWDRICLDDWEPLLNTLQQFGANIHKLELYLCNLTAKGARILRDILNTTSNNNNGNNKWNFCIKELLFEMVEGSLAWIDGFLANTTIVHLRIIKMPVLYSTIQFMLKSPQLKKVLFFDLTSEQRQTTGESFSFETDMHSVSQNESMDLKELIFSIHEEEPFTLSLCQAIGFILRNANNLDKLCFHDVKSGIPYDFLQDAIHCRTLDLCNSDFDLQIISTLIQGNDNGAVAGKLKNLTLRSIKDASKVEDLLQMNEISLLDSFTVACNSPDPLTTECNRLLNRLFRLIAENKGFKRLGICLGNASLTEFASRLALSLIGNDKIERLELISLSFGDELGPQKELLNAMGQMPRLQSWKVRVYRSSRDQEAVEKWKQWIPLQLQSNWNIQDIDPPFKLGEDIKEMLIFNKHWHKLVCSHDQISSGIWSPALSRIKTFDLMYRVIREVPSLFREVASKCDANTQKPSFVVPHRVNCPGCRMKRKKR